MLTPSEDSLDTALRPQYSAGFHTGAGTQGNPPQRTVPPPPLSQQEYVYIHVPSNSVTPHWAATTILLL